MTNPDLQETIEALEPYADPDNLFELFDFTNVAALINNALTLLKAQQEQIEKHHKEMHTISRRLAEIVCRIAPPQTEDK